MVALSWQLRAVVAGGGPSLDVGQIPISGHPSGLEVTPDGTAWMWGDRMRPLLSRDGGRTWTDMPLGEVDGSSPVTAAVPLDAQHGLALLWDPNQQATLLEATTDGGQTWSARHVWPVSSPSPSTAGLPTVTGEVPGPDATIPPGVSVISGLRARWTGRPLGVPWSVVPILDGRASRHGWRLHPALRAARCEHKCRCRGRSPVLDAGRCAEPVNLPHICQRTGD